MSVGRDRVEVEPDLLVIAGKSDARCDQWPFPGYP